MSDVHAIPAEGERGMSITIPRVGEYIGFVGAHPNNRYRVLEADENGVIIDFIGSYRSVSLDKVVFHAA